MPDWREWFETRPGTGTLAHPDSPTGGTGTGASRLPGAGNSGWNASRVPHPDSPPAHGFLWGLWLEAVDLEERAEAVYDAVVLAEGELPGQMLEATGEELHSMVAGALRGLMIALAIVAVPTAGGAAIGGVFGFGVGAVGGAAVGFEVGVWILDYLGLAMLGGYLLSGLAEAAALAKEGGRIAWQSVDHPEVKRQRLRLAGGKMAQAVTVIFRRLLQGIVAYLVSEGSAAAASRVPELVATLRESKLGGQFAAWVEENWSRLLENPKLRDTTTSGGGVKDEPPLARQPAKVEKSVEPEKSADDTKAADQQGAATPDRQLIDARRQRVEDAVRKNGITDPAKIESHVDGADLTKPVITKNLEPGDTFDVWVRDGGKPGIYGTPSGTDPSTLGIDPTGRHLETYEVQQPMSVTESTANDFDAGKGIPGVGGQGGGQQYILPPNWSAAVKRTEP